MAEHILIGRGAAIEALPAAIWRGEVEQMRTHGSTRLAFMTPDHHRVRAFVVRELPRNQGEPLAPRQVAAGLDLPLQRVVDILDELERNLFFLVRDEAGRVSWAFPVTSDRTPHHLRFSSGERLWGA